MSEPLPRGVTPDVARGGLPDDLTAGVDFAALDRWPLPTEPDRQAHDAADLLLLDTLAGWIASGHVPGPVAVLEDRHGALTLPLLTAGHDVRIHQDDASAERSLDANLAAWRAAGRLGGETGELERTATPEEAARGARTVLLPLPRSLDELDRLSRIVAGAADPGVVLLAGGRDKHMSPRMNAVLGAAFEDVVAGRGRRKARVLTARGPRPGVTPRPPEEADRDVPGVGRLHLVAHAGAFGGAAADPGSRLLLASLADDPRPPGRVVDLGCGNGLLSVGAARLWPHVTVLATDQSAVAVASTLATARANRVADRVRAVRDDALATWPDGTEECVLLNPPFHDGNAVDPSVAHRLVAAAARVLEPGGRLWCVWNSHLRYRPVLEDLVGPTRQTARDRTFTVTVSERR